MLWLFELPISCCFKEQRYKINASNSQQAAFQVYQMDCCFKEQRYKFWTPLCVGPYVFSKFITKTK